jgi:heme/copper-type cytochrome/quinol oxidase subunit 2
LCGLGHFRMRGFVTVQSQSDFQKWFDDQEKELRKP